MKRLTKMLAFVLVIAVFGFLSTSAIAHAGVGVSGDMNGDGYNDTAVINTNGAVAIFHGPGYWNSYCRCWTYWETDYAVQPNWRTANSQRTTYNNNLNIVVNYVCLTFCQGSVFIVDDAMRWVRGYSLPYWDLYVPGPGVGSGVADPTYIRVLQPYSLVYVVNDVLMRVYSSQVRNGWDNVYLQDVTGDGMKDVIFHYRLNCDAWGCHQGWFTFDPNADQSYWYQT
jgi:hypothetical protein